MAYFRTIPKINVLLNLLNKEDKWLIVINADPDAMASALALKRIMSKRVKEATIAKINEISRPDNLAMQKYCRIEMKDLTPELRKQYNKFAIVDSQPHHSPAFKDIPFSIVIDHHPLPLEPYKADYVDIHPEYGANSTLMTEHLYNLKIKPGKLLATALQYGIKTDTNSFERCCFDIDLRAYRYLAQVSNHALLSKIARSEFRKEWLKYFAKAYANMYSLSLGEYSFIGRVNSPDILVIIADLFMRVYEIQWDAIAGIYDDKAIVVFRSSSSSKDVGSLAAKGFGDIGSAGGHKSMARAEFPVTVAQGENIELFIWQRLVAAQKHSAAKTNSE